MRIGSATLVIGVGLAAAVALGTGGRDSLSAQEEGGGTPAAGTPAAAEALPLVDRPVRIVTGSCAAPGETVAELTDLVAPAGEAVGQDGAVVAEGAFTSVPIALDSLLDADHAIVVGSSAEEPERLVACGEIGGIFDADGALVIGLQGSAGTGVAGIAYLFRSDDDLSTNVSTFLAGGYTAGMARAGGGATPVPTGSAEGEGEAEEEVEDDAPGESLDVSLHEWAIELPESVAAGLVIFTITNDGTEAHSFDLSGNGVSAFLDLPLAPGESGSLSVNLPPGVYTIVCPLGEGEHAANGMVAELTVE